MSADSEIALTYRAWDEEKKRRKRDRLNKADSTGWTKHTTYHWSRMVKGHKLDYWPSTGLCRYKGKRMNINGKRVKKLLEENNNVQDD